MSEELMNEKIEEMLRMPAEEVKEILSLTLDEIRKYGIREMMEEVPDLLSKIMRKLVEVEATRFLSEVPEVSDKFMDLLWEGVGVLAGKSKELRPVLERTREINVNFEASDSPLRGHFRISQGKLYGGSGLLHFKEQDFRFFGPTEVSILLLSGELASGFGNLKLQTEGNPGLLSSIAPIIQGISKLIKGEQ